MFSFRHTRQVATFAVIAGLLAVAAPAGAVTDNKHPEPRVFSGDAYDNEMGVIGARDGTGVVLMADMGGQFSRTSPPADGIIAVLIGL